MRDSEKQAIAQALASLALGCLQIGIHDGGAAKHCKHLTDQDLEDFSNEFDAFAAGDRPNEDTLLRLMYALVAKAGDVENLTELEKVAAHTSLLIAATEGWL
jgi:hypothetical protein